MRQVGCKVLAALSCICSSTTTGFTIPVARSLRTTTTTTTTTSLDSMKDTLESLGDKVIQKFGLQGTDFCDTFNAKTWVSDSGVYGTAMWMSESSPNWLTGVSLCTRVNSDATNEQLTINIWMGPSYDVPNMLLTFGEESNGKYSVVADYVVRGSIPIGSDPPYLESYYGDDVRTAWTKAYSLGQPLPPTMEFESRMLDSPAKIAVGGLTKADADSIAQEHLDRFLVWVDGASTIPARSRGSMNMRDDKIRQFFYRGQVRKQVQEFGPGLGPTIAAVNTGPTAEAYVGGGS